MPDNSGGIVTIAGACVHHDTRELPREPESHE
jgi:hypothetical protein